MKKPMARRVGEKSAWGKRWLPRRQRCMSLSAATSLLLVLLSSGCSFRSSPLQSESIENLAVVVRVEAEPAAQLDEAEASELGMGEDASELLRGRLSQRVSPYALEESVRQAWIEALLEPVRWRIVPSLQVASAMGSLLAREDAPRYDRLARIDVDAVLEIRITEWGVRSRGDFFGGYLRMEARVIRLDGKERVSWRARERLDRSRDGVMPSSRMEALIHGDESAIEEMVADLAGSAGTQLARTMGVGEGR